MALIEQNYNLDLVPSGKPMVVNVSQYDKDSRRLVFNLFNGGVAYAPETGTAAYIMGSKPDQTGFFYGMTVEGTKASVDIYQQMTAVAGNIPCEIRLADPSGAVIGSANFTLAVEKAAMDEDEVISETDIPVFENLAAQAAASAAEAADSATAAAQTAASIHGIPAGGTAGQILTKGSATDYDAGWEDIDALPAGGSAGQVLTKQSSVDGDAVWGNIEAPPGDLAVTLTLTTQTGRYSADHTYDEIMSNIAAGGSPYAVYNTNVYHIATIGSTWIIFSKPSIFTDGFSLTNTNTWIYIQQKPTALNTAYTNTTSGLTATTVQAAIDELKAAMAGLLPVFSGFGDHVGVITLGDMLIEYGTVQVTSPANGVGSAQVTFTNEFESKPCVMVTAGAVTPGTTVKMVSAADFTVDGFKAYCSRTNTTPTTVLWLAIGKKANND